MPPFYCVNFFTSFYYQAEAEKEAEEAEKEAAAARAEAEEARYLVITP